MAKQKFDLGAEAAGIPDSPIFQREVSAEEPNPTLSLHVGGVLVSDLPLEAQGRIVYQQTDEAMAERNARPQVREPSGISFGADEVTKGCAERKDAIVERGMEPWEAPNQMRDLADTYTTPGFKAKFLSPNKVDKDGTRGYRIVKHANGDPVKCRNMPMGEMPIERVEARNKFYRDKSANALGEAKKQFMDEGGKLSVSGE